jgi:FMN phosphatase YigB (HAD superfamily)
MTKIHKFSASWAVPKKGFLELDFVQIKKPTSQHNLSTDEEIERLLRRFHSQTDEENLMTIRDWFNRKVIMCKQVESMLMALKRDKSRVELLVAAFARVLDWHGYSSLLSLISNC